MTGAKGMAPPAPDCLVIGIGNPGRGDDDAGRAVARWLRGQVAPDCRIVEHDGEAASLFATFEGAATVCLIDACVSGAPAGTVRRFDAVTAPLPQGAFGLSTHRLGLAEAIELARALGQLPDRCVVYAIEGLSFRPGAQLSPPVTAAVPLAGRQVLAELLRILPRHATTSTR